MIIIFNIIYLILFLYISKNGLYKLIVVFIYLVPCNFGNKLGPFYPPPNPLLALLIVITILGVFKYKYYQKSEVSKSGNLYLLYGLLTSLIGFIFLPQQYLEVWIQSPIDRVIRTYSYEILFICLPLIIKFYFELYPEKLPKIAVHILRSGFFYAGLGLIQFLIFKIFSYDLFAIIREVQGQEVFQSFFDDEGISRVTSIAGEPRYLASFITFWIFFLVFLWEKIEISLKTKSLFLITYVSVLILTSSRTGILSLLLIILIGPFEKKNKDNKNTKSILLIILVFVLLIIYSQIGIRNNLGTGEGYTVEMNLFGLYMLELEPPDYYTLTTSLNHLFNLIFGFGSGLFQYYFDPFFEINVFRFFSDRSSLDSWKSNIGPLVRLSNFGIVGLILLINYFDNFYRSYCSKLKTNFRLFFYTIIIYIGLLKFAELYALCLLPIFLQYYLKNTTISRTLKYAK